MNGRSPGVHRWRICFVVSSPETASSFLNPHIERLAEDFDVDVVANFHDNSPSSVSEVARRIPIRILRQVNLLADLQALVRLRRLLKRSNYQVIHSVTPKAGLIAMLAAASLGIPHRFHWFTGQVWATKQGLKRRVLKFADRTTARLATRLLVDSTSQLDFLVHESVFDRSKATVLGDGSICGVDTDRFRPDPDTRTRVRGRLGIDDEAFVILFVGRINEDKGVLDLASSMRNFTARQKTWLVLVGSDESRLLPTIEAMMHSSSVDFLHIDHSGHPEEYMCAADVFCLPSHREGFGLSAIEASACELPCVGTDIYGLRDAISHGHTGLLFSVRDTEALCASLEELADDPAYRTRLGSAGRRRVIKNFNQGLLTEALRSEYQRHVLAGLTETPHHG